jgi:hypothetical protein
MINDIGKPNPSERNLSQCYSVHHKFHIDHHGLKRVTFPVRIQQKTPRHYTAMAGVIKV